MPWLLLGDFNNVLNDEEKSNGLPVTQYEVSDFMKCCCYDIGISDLRSTGVFFTWSNNTVWSKLDRAMVNVKWGQEGLLAQVNFGLPGKFSDHSPCVITLFGDNDQGPRPFKFFNMWTKHEDFLNVVDSSWSMQVEGTAMFKLCRKLKVLKGPLKALNKMHFSHISARAAAAEEDLLQVQQQLHDNPTDSSLQIRVASLKKQSFRLAEADRSFCLQVAEAKYLKNCDKGTKFFHDLIKNNRAKSQIVALTKEDGSSTTSIQQPVLDKEIKSALFSIGDDKAPGPDGYSSCFFKSAWSIVGPDVCAAVKEFFVSGKILKQLNHAVIALVPKTASASRVEEFRPIACCNVIYKVISKILAARLSPILESLIDPGQSAFVPNRSMVENIYMVQELLRKYCWNRISPRCIMKVDLRKAYDTVNWNFLEDVLSGLGFPALFIQWIMQCVSTTSYSISINGSLHGFFKGKQVEISWRRLRPSQGSVRADFHSDIWVFLWLPLGLTIEQFNPLITKISDYVSAWAGATLSYAGRSELIRSVLQGVECFWLSILPIPVGVRDKVISLCRNFLWGGKAVSFKKPLVAWREICRPKPEGGLGFIDLHAWNLALLSKSLWKIQSKKDSLWVKWVHQERLLTRDKLIDQIEDTSCSLCNSPVESLNHLFFQCPVANQVWVEIKSWLGFSRALTTLKAAAKWIIKEARGTGVQAVAKKVGFACTVYYIWATRNARMFEGKIVHPTGIIRDIKIQVYRVLHASFPNLREL
ncbi:hypothetical protein Acr_19g0000030 [Actinidia rufa]|uniref:Reverse transcriptase domain-containing protein n=1 Tax=Actinidia rufa TaxID=165716 RepID=A0A7J0G8D9_9ERIC|nr:hypothetical protein Acr_19g0000030 [Actinidia rufa]